MARYRTALTAAEWLGDTYPRWSTDPSSVTNADLERVRVLLDGVNMKPLGPDDTWVNCVADGTPLPPDANPGWSAPTPALRAWRAIPASNGPGSGLAVVGKAVISFGRFSSIPDRNTFRLIVKVKNRAGHDVEVESGYPSDSLSDAQQTHVILHYSDGRKPRTEVASTIYAQISAGDTDFISTGGAMTADEYAAVASVQIVAKVRIPRYEQEVWTITTALSWSSSGDIVAAGTLENNFGNEVMAPLLFAIYFDAEGVPITYSVGSGGISGGIALGDSADWTLTETLPTGITAADATVQVFPDSSADKWGPFGDQLREIISIMDLHGG